MALKFLNKKGWHTGSLRNIENVWKAEQKHEAEQRKLEELRKQIHEERERDEFRVLQEQAGLTPRQERLEFLYDSGLSVGKPSSEGFKALETQPSADNSASAAAAAASSSTQSATPGALFEDKPQSANDAWRKLHSDPLLMIRQREQEALARIKNNPVKMAMIRKSVESKKKAEEFQDEERQKVKSKHKKHSSKHHSGSESDSREERERQRKVKHRRKENHSDTESDFSEERERKRKVEKKKYRVDSDEDSRDRSRYHRHSHRDHNEKPQRNSSGKQISDRSKDSERTLRGKEKARQDYDLESNNDRSGQRAIDNGRSNQDHVDSDEDSRDRRGYHRHSRRDYDEKPQRNSSGKQISDRSKDSERTLRGTEKSKQDYDLESNNDRSVQRAIDNGRPNQASDSKHNALPTRQDSHRRRGRAPQLTEEERAARLREMQMDAEVHEEQRWKRLKKADEDDAREARQAGHSQGRSFLHSVQKSVFGAEKGGSSTIEESVRRRSHYLQGRTADEGNAFRR